MLILGLESSGQTASCALAEQTDALVPKSVAEVTLNVGLKHSETLLPMVESVLRLCGLSSSDIGAIAVSVGPGSFTGVRIGCATAKGLAWSAGAKVIPVSSLEAVAYSSYSSNTRPGVTLSAEIDARNGFIYNALFRSGRHVTELRRLTPDRVISRVELAQTAESFATGSDVTAWGVILAAIGKPFGDAEPVYLRQSQAERLQNAK